MNARTKSEEGTMPLSRRLVIRSVIVVALSLVLFGLGVRFGYELLANKVDCFNDYANANADAVDARTKPAVEASDSELNAWQHIDTFLAQKPPGSDQVFTELRVAIASHVSKLKKLQAERTKTPYPDPPREVCR